MKRDAGVVKWHSCRLKKIIEGAEVFCDTIPASFNLRQGPKRDDYVVVK